MVGIGAHNIHDPEVLKQVNAFVVQLVIKNI